MGIGALKRTLSFSFTAFNFMLPLLLLVLLLLPLLLGAQRRELFTFSSLFFCLDHRQHQQHIMYGRDALSVSQQDNFHAILSFSILWKLHSYIILHINWVSDFSLSLAFLSFMSRASNGNSIGDKGGCFFHSMLRLPNNIYVHFFPCLSISDVRFDAIIKIGNLLW